MHSLDRLHRIILPRDRLRRRALGGRDNFKEADLGDATTKDSLPKLHVNHLDETVRSRKHSKNVAGALLSTGKNSL